MNTQNRVESRNLKTLIPNGRGGEHRRTVIRLRPAGGLPPTGDDRVDAAVAGLVRLAGAPADEHVAVLEEVHGRLRDILGEVSEGTP